MNRGRRWGILTPENVVFRVSVFAVVDYFATVHSPKNPMFFGLDTVFALYSLLGGAQAAVTAHDQAHDRPSYAALEAAWSAVERLGIEPDSIECIAVIDFTKPSYLKRMDIYRPGECRAERFFCAHGRNTGGIFAVDFSNRSGSNQTSLGLYRVGNQYRGSWGSSLLLHGLEPGLNDRALKRRIVLHSAWYVSEEIISLNIAEGLGPRIGRSQGCPAVRKEDLATVLARLQPGTFLYIHGNAP